MTDTEPAQPPTPTPTPTREIGIDVTRAIALIGVCVMNYHGYLNQGAATDDTGFWGRTFNPWTGPLSTRFAATFVTVAGIGVVLLTRRATASGDRAAIAAQRWRLARRGLLLFAFGYFLDWVWQGTILFFYGAYFVVGAFLFTLRARWLLAIGAAAALAAAALQWWALGHDIDDVLYGYSEFSQSPTDLLLDATVRGTHPLLPWLVFFCIGMALGKTLPWRSELKVYLAFGGTLAVLLGYGLSGRLWWHPDLQTTHPFDRGVLYVLTTVGTSVLAVMLISSIAERTKAGATTQALAVAGRTTLSLYVLHVLIFRLLVDWLGWVEPGSGLVAALLFAGFFWVTAVMLANVWSWWRPLGPAEWLYRRLSD